MELFSVREKLAGLKRFSRRANLLFLISSVFANLPLSVTTPLLSKTRNGIDKTGAADAERFFGGDGCNLYIIIINTHRINSARGSLMPQVIFAPSSAGPAAAEQQSIKFLLPSTISLFVPISINSESFSCVCHSAENNAGGDVSADKAGDDPAQFLWGFFV